MESHIVLTKWQSRNHRIARSLNEIGFAFGIDQKSKPIRPFLQEGISKAVNDFIEQNPKPPTIEAIPIIDVKEQEPAFIDPMMLLKRSRRPKKSRHARSNTAISELKSQISMVEIESKKQPDPKTPSDFLLALAIGMKVGGFAVGMDFDCATGFHGVFKSTLRSLMSCFREKFDERESEMRSQLNLMNRCAQSMLLIEKCDIAIQTNPVERFDVETMTAKPEPEVTTKRRR
jgi:hypothetical protein